MKGLTDIKQACGGRVKDAMIAGERAGQRQRDVLNPKVRMKWAGGGICERPRPV